VWMPRRSARTLIAPLDMIHHSDSSWRASRASQPTAARFVSVTKYVTAGHCSRASEREEEGESTGFAHARERTTIKRGLGSARLKRVSVCRSRAAATGLR
jgi:hypothetical protein